MPEHSQPGSHAKFYMLDGAGFYVGSQNMYPSGIRSTLHIPELNEFGFYVDARPTEPNDLSNEATKRIVVPSWERARERYQAHQRVGCAALPHQVRLQGSTGAPGHFTCASAFDLDLNFYDVAYDEVAAVSGQTTCTSAGRVVNVTIAGKIATEGVFTGTISGVVPGVAADTADLRGTFREGSLDLSFADLEPIHGVSYSGTVRSLGD
ncbi:hypothetical protein WME75_33230 [Sorangium sp. So ce1014]|uniref:hypothetical protein n=1 Tax=Sorangium sp. So ce1014 TaxID=3133326 RepID=UPI003F5EB7C9